MSDQFRIMTDCYECNGEGRIYTSRYGGNDPDTIDKGQCPVCNGKGLVPREEDCEDNEEGA